MIRTKGEAGSGNIVEAVRHMRAVVSGIRRLTTLGPEELMTEAKNLGAPYELVRWIARTGKLPVPNFSAGGIATPADAALMMQLGAEAVFVGSGIFKSADPAKRARAIVQATTHFKDPDVLAQGVARIWARRCPASRSPSWRRRTCCRRAAGRATAEDVHTLPAGLPVPGGRWGDRRSSPAAPPVPARRRCRPPPGGVVDLRRLAGGARRCCSSIRAPARQGSPPGRSGTPFPARAGCTPQSCGFRDLARGVRAPWASASPAVSTQDDGVPARVRRAQPHAVRDPERRRPRGSPGRSRCPLSSSRAERAGPPR